MNILVTYSIYILDIVVSLNKKMNILIFVLKSC